MKYSPQNELTFAELQLISSALKSRLDFLNANVGSLKDEIQYCYERCDKEDASTKDWFSNLNAAKNILREYNKEKNKLAEIQRKIKRQLGGQR